MLLLSELALGGKGAPNLAALRKTLGELIDTDKFKLDSLGEATVELTIPARNDLERDRIKGLINSGADGWKVIERQTYSLPKSL